MPITQILLTSNTTGGGGGGTTPDGILYINNIPSAWGSVGVQPDNKPTYSEYFAFPDTVTTGSIWDFNGSDQFMTTGTIGGATEMYLNIWFYPTDASRVIMTIQGSLDEQQSYHHTALDINANLTVSGGFWNGFGIIIMTTDNTVTLNAWNHIYLRHNGTQALLQLNGGTAVTNTHGWSSPNANGGLPLVLGFGTTSFTNNGISARYQGGIADVFLDTTNTASNYESTRSKYEAPPLQADFTVEWWQKMENNGNNARAWSVGLYPVQKIAVSYEGGTSDYYWINDSAIGNVSRNHIGQGWQHMAMVRYNGVVKGYENGVEYFSSNNGNSPITATNVPLYVGTGEIAAGTYRGYIKDLHIIKGTAKYTGNFTPPYLPASSQTGSVFLLPAMSDGTKYDDTVGSKSGSVTGTVTYSEDDPWTYPGATFTAIGYGNNLITPNPMPANLRIGLKVSDGLGWSDYIINPNYFGNIQLLSLPANLPPELVYTVSEETNQLTININYGGTSGGVSEIEGRFSQYPATVALSAVRAGWTYLDPDGGTGTITNNAYISGESVFLVVSSPILGTWTFTPPAYGGSLYFNGSSYLNYGASSDWAIDV